MALHPALQRLADDFRDAKTAAETAGIPARVLFLEDIFRKNLILSAASLFEHRITESIIQHTRSSAAGSDCVVSLVVNKAVKRQYHTYFDWDKENLGSFPTLLGESLGGRIKLAAKNAPTDAHSAAFLALGSLRNQLVHKNFAVFVCEKTSEEVILLCEQAELFVQSVEQLLNPP